MPEKSNSGESLGDVVAKAIGEPGHARAKQSIDLLRSMMNSNADVLLGAIQSIGNEMRQSGELSDNFVALLRGGIKTEMALRIDRAQSADRGDALRFYENSLLCAIPLIMERTANEAAKTAANEPRSH